MKMALTDCNVTINLVDKTTKIFMFWYTFIKNKNKCWWLINIWSGKYHLEDWYLQTHWICKGLLCNDRCTSVLYYVCPLSSSKTCLFDQNNLVDHDITYIT